MDNASLNASLVYWLPRSELCRIRDNSDYAEEKTMPKNLITSCILIIRIQFFGIVFRVSQARRLLSLYQRSSIAFRHRQLWEQTC